jgi:magnesium-transporting ATPase (P-type)
MNDSNNMKGLTSAEVAERLTRYGPNSLPQPRYRLAWLIFRQFRGIFNLLLRITPALRTGSARRNRLGPNPAQTSPRMP